jgi:CubicO group peptidase (beta-lactamase class C family)
MMCMHDASRAASLLRLGLESGAPSDCSVTGLITRMRALQSVDYPACSAELGSMPAPKLRDTQALDAVLKRYSLPDDASSGTVPGRDDSGLLPGVALAVRGRDGVLYSGSGNSRIQSSTPVWIASCTKLVTPICILQLVERGLIGLDDPVQDYVPDVPLSSVYEKLDADGKPILRPAK